VIVTLFAFCVAIVPSPETCPAGTEIATVAAEVDCPRGGVRRELRHLRRRPVRADGHASGLVGSPGPIDKGTHSGMLLLIFR
jgi:hypothetical protein